MKERKTYEVPSITVISMDDHADIIQTSAVLANIGNLDDSVGIVDVDISSLFN